MSQSPPDDPEGSQPGDHEETAVKVFYTGEASGGEGEQTPGGSTEPKTMEPIQETGGRVGVQPIEDGLEAALLGAVGGRPDPTAPPIDTNDVSKIPIFNETVVENLPAYKEPQCLISTTDRMLRANVEVLNQLKELSSRMHLVVVAIAGLYRTGKSYMMSRLAGQTQGFQLGSTIVSKTKGIWIWIRKHPTSKQKLLVLIDTEGLGDIEKGDANHDHRIFCLTILLSSVLVYNSLGVIDDDSLDKISFILGMAQHISTRGSESGDDGDFDVYFPSFIFALRDFTLELRDGDEEISADDYLDRALSLRTGSDEATKRHNEIRKCILRYFRSRRCFTFDRPGSRSQLRNLETQPDSQLSCDFLTDMNAFRDHIISRAPVKKMETGQAYNGRMWAETVEQWTSAISAGIIPDIETTIRIVSKAENERLGTEGLKIYIEHMKKLQLPTETAEELTDHHRRGFLQALKHFTDGVVFDIENKYNIKMNEDIEKQLIEFKKKNTEASVNKCNELLDRLSKNIDEKAKNDSYTKPGGFMEYHNDLEDLREKYNDTSSLGIEKNNCFVLFQVQRRSEGLAISSSDKVLSQRQKAQEEEKFKELESTIEKFKEATEKSFQAELEHERERARQITLEQVGLKKAKVLDGMIAQYENILKHRRSVEKKLRDEGQKEDADKTATHVEKLERELTKLKEDRKKANAGCTIL